METRVKYPSRWYDLPTKEVQKALVDLHDFVDECLWKDRRALLSEVLTQADVRRMHPAIGLGLLIATPKRLPKRAEYFDRLYAHLVDTLGQDRAARLLLKHKD